LTLVELQKHDAAGRSPAQNALFAGHELGAGNWAAIASLVETCKLNAINPNAYLADVLARVVVRPDGDPLTTCCRATGSIPGLLKLHSKRATSATSPRPSQQTTFETSFNEN